MNSLFAIRTFSTTGINEFERIIGEIRSGSLNEVPQQILFDEDFTEPLEPIINIEKVSYKNKSEFVPYVSEHLNLRSNKDLYFNKGLWTWLTAFFFDNVCPVDGNGKRKVNENAFYVLNDPKKYTKYNRHLLAYPCRIYSELGDAAKIFLIGTFQTRGEITEQFGAHQEIALNKGILEAANIMYWDESKKVLKKGAAGKGAGSARRFVRIIGQYQMTYDLKSMNGPEIVDLLPREFSKWMAPV